MASLSRKFLTGLGLNDDQVEAVIEQHVEVTSELKAKIDTLQESADKVADIQKQLDAANKTVKTDSVYKDEYNTLKEEFENYKTEQVKAQTAAAKRSAYENILRGLGVSDRRATNIMRVADFDSVELAEDGSISNSDAVTESIKADWSDFIPQTIITGAETQTPPQQNTNVTTITKEQIMAIKDASKRQKAIAEHLELFEK